MKRLSVSDLKCRYGNKMVLKGIDLVLEKPGIYALVGPNGSGKTTLMNAVANLIPIDSGKISIMGKPHNNVEVFQDFNYFCDIKLLYPYLTGFDHFHILKKVYRLKDKDLQDTFQEMQIESFLQKRVGEYSLGMKQHLLIALSLVAQPKLVFLDEPMNGLDPSNIVKVRRILIEKANQGMTLLVSSHNLFELDQMTDTIYYLKDGALIKERLDIKERVLFFFDQPITDPSLYHDPRFKVGDRVVEIQVGEVSKCEALQRVTRSNQPVIDFQVIKQSSEDRYRELFEL